MSFEFVYKAFLFYEYTQQGINRIKMSAYSHEKLVSYTISMTNTHTPFLVSMWKILVENVFISTYSNTYIVLLPLIYGTL